MKNWENDIKQKLDKLDKIPERNPLKVQSAKKNFLSEARQLAGEVSASIPKNSWWNQLMAKKGTFPMKLITIATILSLFLGGGISAVAAQDSLPGDILYPVKTFVEGIELSIATDPEKEFAIALKHANYRFDEINKLVGKGKIVTEAQFYEWQHAFQKALQLGVETKDPIGKLLMVQQQLKYQELIMNKGPSDDRPHQTRFKNMLNYQTGLLDSGLEEPELLSSELEFMATFSKQYGEEKLEDVWMNMYMFGALDTEDQVGQVQNQGEVQHPVDDSFMWMHLLGNRLTEKDPPGASGQDTPNEGANNSNNNHPNGGNQGDNENGSNGGNGGSGGGNGGK